MTGKIKLDKYSTNPGLPSRWPAKEGLLVSALIARYKTPNAIPCTPLIELS